MQEVIFWGIWAVLGLIMLLYYPVSYTHLDVYKRQISRSEELSQRDGYVQLFL